MQTDRVAIIPMLTSSLADEFQPEIQYVPKYVHYIFVCFICDYRNRGQQPLKGHRILRGALQLARAVAREPAKAQTDQRS